MLTRRRDSIAGWLAACSFVIQAGSALAADGVLEISQVCGVQTGCFSGDAPGFPVTIDGSAGQSYRLTSDLRVEAPASRGLEIASGFAATIDLGGFELRGPACDTSVDPPACASPSGTAHGISVNDFVRSVPVEVRNGVVTQFAGDGIRLCGGLVLDVRVTLNGGGVSLLCDGGAVRNSIIEDNRQHGIAAAPSSAIEGNRVVDNLSDGISCSFGGCIVTGNVLTGNQGVGVRVSSAPFSRSPAVVSRNLVESNGGNGIEVRDASVVSNNAVRQNGGDGIAAGPGASISDNTSNENGAMGIRAFTGSTVTGNTTRANGDDGISAGEGVSVTSNTSSANGDDGIAAGAGSLVERNTTRGNGTTSANGVGLALLGDAVYRGNVSTANASAQASGGVNLDDNYCSGPGSASASCP